MKIEISNWRWAGTPFYIRTGKRLRARASEIAIVFKDIIRRNRKTYPGDRYAII